MAARQIVQLMHEPVEREAAQGEKEKREQTPGQEQCRCSETNQMQIEMAHRPKVRQAAVLPGCGFRRRACCPHASLRRLGAVVISVRGPFFLLFGVGNALRSEERT